MRRAISKVLSCEGLLRQMRIKLEATPKDVSEEWRKKTLEKGK